MSEQVGIQGIIDLMDALKVLALFGKKVSADGKVDMADLPLLFDLVKQASVFSKAASEISDIPAEVKDISIAEAQEILGKIFAVIAEVKAA